MSEESMVALMQAALVDQGIDDTIEVAGQFAPRGRSGAMMAGGFLGAGAASDVAGEVASGLGLGAGMAAGSKAGAKASGLPAPMLVGVSETTVYGMHTKSRRKEPDRIVFQVPRAGLKVNVHQRLNVRVLELVDESSGASVELEGGRVPVTHAKDVIEYLSRDGG
jgi:hypothetical protein